MGYCNKSTVVFMDISIYLLCTPHHTTMVYVSTSLCHNALCAPISQSDMPPFPPSILSSQVVVWVDPLDGTGEFTKGKA